MRGFKQFWPLYLIYAIEVVVFAIALVFVIVARLAPVLGNGNATAVLDISSMHLVLAAPAVIGFYFRYYFIKGLWIIYAWLHAFAFSGAGAVANAEWVVVLTVFSHPVVVTAVLLFSTAGRTYFSRTFERELHDEPAEESLFVRPAEALLRKRLYGRDVNQPPRSQYHHRLMQISLIGGAMMIWGYVLKLFVVGSFGFIIVLVCFVMHRKSAGNRKLFMFRNNSSDG